MARIPFQPSGQVGVGTPKNPRASADAATAPWRAVEGVGRLIGGMGADYIERKATAKKQADLSDYEIRKEALRGELAQLETDALKRGINYDDIPDQVLAPRVAEFEEELYGLAYSDDVMTGVQSDWGIEREKIKTSAILKVEKMELMDHTERIKRDAFSDINAGEQEKGFGKLDQLAGIIGIDAVNSMKSLGLYGKATNEMAESRDVNDIKATLANVPKELMEPQQYQAVVSYANSRMSTLTAQEYAPANKDFSKLLSSNELTSDVIEASPLPREMKDDWQLKLNNSISANIVADRENYNKGYGYVQEFMTGNYKGFKKDEYANLQKDLNKLDLPANVLAEVMEPIFSSMGDPQTNKKFYDPANGMGGYTTKQSEAFTDLTKVFEDTYGNSYASVKIAGYGNAYSEMWRWLKDNPNYTETEKNDKVKELTAIPVSNYLQQTLNPIAAPTQEKPSEDPMGLFE